MAIRFPERERERSLSNRTHWTRFDRSGLVRHIGSLFLCVPAEGAKRGGYFIGGRSCRVKTTARFETIHTILCPMRVHIGNRTTQGLCGKRISRKKKEGKKTTTSESLSGPSYGQRGERACSSCLTASSHVSHGARRWAASLFLSCLVVGCCTIKAVDSKKVSFFLGRRRPAAETDNTPGLLSLFLCLYPPIGSALSLSMYSCCVFMYNHAEDMV